MADLQFKNTKGDFRPEAIQKFLDSVREQVETLKRGAEVASDEAFAFEALQREIFFRREDSIRSQIRQLVLRTLAGESDVEDVAKQVVQFFKTACNAR